MRRWDARIARGVGAASLLAGCAGADGARPEVAPPAARVVDEPAAVSTPRQDALAEARSPRESTPAPGAYAAPPVATAEPVTGPKPRRIAGTPCAPNDPKSCAGGQRCVASIDEPKAGVCVTPSADWPYARATPSSD